MKQNSLNDSFLVEEILDVLIPRKNNIQSGLYKENRRDSSLMRFPNDLQSRD